MRELRNKLRSSSGVAGSVDFLGTLAPEALPGLYAGATAFIGMGTAAVEAAMQGAPCRAVSGVEAAESLGVRREVSREL